ncbi:hypothetical protein Taro_050027 [Colocasia esculenta]|uniref:Uncharacterized protein n=1 Tax=Colocasia esculenta TaxID=4460 RepID=A0A843XCD2_COLES|nr:hypothetical protein [Colocasia esculenta]
MRDTKTSVAEGEAIIGEVPEIPPVQEEEADVRIEEPPASVRRIEDIAPALIEPVGQSTERVIPSAVPAPTIEESVILETVTHVEGEQENTLMEDIPSVPTVDAFMEVILEEVISEVVAPGHTENIQMEDAPAQGEPEIQGETTASAPADQFQEGIVEDVLDENMEPIISFDGKRKGVSLRIPPLTRKAHHRSKKRKIHVHMKPVINRLNAHGEILCSLQSEVQSIFISQSTEAKEIGAVKTELQEMRSELGSLKQLVSNLSEFVRAQLSVPAPSAPTQSVPEEAVRPPGPCEEEVRPSGPSEEEVRPPGSSVEESGPSGPVESVAEPVRFRAPIDVAAVPPEPAVPSSLQTPAPSFPPTSSSAPPALEPSKKPLPKHISSPTPFPATSSSSPISSTAIPPLPPTFEEPPASSSAGPSSSSPSFVGPSAPPPPTSFSSIHPPTPPSFITIIPEGARVQGHIIQDIKDEFEEAIFSPSHMPDIVFLPKLHSLLMDSAVGPIIFERFARVMAIITVQQGAPLAFHRFLFREYHRGYIKSNVLAPLLSECERHFPSDWEKHYHVAAQQLDTLNLSLARSNKPSLSAEEFLDLNSINLVQDPFAIWVERYKVYVPLKRELKQHKIFYPLSIDKFLQHASFGTTSLYRSSFGGASHSRGAQAKRELLINVNSHVVDSTAGVIAVITSYNSMSVRVRGGGEAEDAGVTGEGCEESTEVVGENADATGDCRDVGELGVGRTGGAGVAGHATGALGPITVTGDGGWPEEHGNGPRSPYIGRRTPLEEARSPNHVVEMAAKDGQASASSVGTVPGLALLVHLGRFC